MMNTSQSFEIPLQRMINWFCIWARLKFVLTQRDTGSTKSNQFLENVINENIIILWTGVLKIPELLRRG